MTRSSPGFSLTEVVVVLAIFSLLTVVALPYVGARRQQDGANDVATKLVAFMKQAKLDANRTSRPVSVKFSLKGARQVKANPGDTVMHLPDTVTIQATTARLGTSIDEALFVFLPSGESTGGTVSVTSGSDKRIVSVEWLTGRVTVGPGSAGN
jgi:prepilin-type N-terminal cleavage/methylation domain-containing protein